MDKDVEVEKELKLKNSRKYESLSQEDKERWKEGWAEHNFNQFISDLIPLSRANPDPRDPLCKKLPPFHPTNFTKRVMPVDIIIIFHNEAWSTLLRTIHSVINNTPPDFIKTIILVDDFSYNSDLKKPLEDYLKEHFKEKVKLDRSKRRLGVAGARVRGVELSSAPVLVFLDSHCECTIGWLEPLLHQLLINEKSIAVPTVDVIDKDTFEYLYDQYPDNLTNDQYGVWVGGFTWKLDFDWIFISANQDAYIKSRVHPVKSPTMPGGLFAIRKNFFVQLGLYNKHFQIWGGENLEISFKTWMCGGQIVQCPCSHVGHLFRYNAPYPIHKQVILKNLALVAEIWMGDYSNYFYQRLNLTYKLKFSVLMLKKDRLLRARCRPFNWYLENVATSIMKPGNAIRTANIQLRGRNLCLHFNGSNDVQPTVQPGPMFSQQVFLTPCGRPGEKEDKVWYVMEQREIRRDSWCLASTPDGVYVIPCLPDFPQSTWIYFSELKRIYHVHENKCLTVRRSIVAVAFCNKRDPNQMWSLDDYISPY